MGWWFDKDNRCTYEEWVEKSGGLLKFIDSFCGGKGFRIALELGTGNSTRALSKRCENVITVDINKDSVIVPVDEQGPSGLSKQFWSGLRKEDNVDFICGDILSMDLSFIKSHKIDLILFDLGTTAEDKYLYRLAYDRLKDNNIITDDCILLADNQDTPDAIKFRMFLEDSENYKTEVIGGQFIARKVKNDSR